MTSVIGADLTFEAVFGYAGRISHDSDIINEGVGAIKRRS